jgi:2,3-dihydroxybenzoate-AMP ligase
VNSRRTFDHERGGGPAQPCANPCPGQRGEQTILDGCQPWPPELAESYRAAGYWRDRTLGEELKEWASRYRERTALVDGYRRWSYSEVDVAADLLAAGLRRQGINVGDRIVIQLPNIAEFVVVCFALFRLGVLPVLALPSHRIEEIAHLCELSEAVGYLTVDTHAGFDYRELARQLRPAPRHVLILGDAEEFTTLAELITGDAGEPAPPYRPDPGDVALFLLSGGTTALPKLIPRTHNDYEYTLRASAQVCRLDESTVYLTALPVAHNFALGCPGVLGTLYAGGTVVFAPNPSPPEVFPIIERERVTITALVPPLALLWMMATQWVAADLSSLRVLQVGGAKLGAEPASHVRRTLGCQLQQVFGMAEGLLNYTRLDDPEDIVVSTQGRPLSPADEIRIVDEQGVDVEPGQVGELLTRGPYTLRGYYRAQSHNATAFTPEGYYCSGDLVRRTPTGHLVVEGRVKDVINRGGEKVSAAEVENHLLTHPAVQDAAMVAVPDDRLGELTCAVVIASGEAPTLRQLKAFLRNRGVAAYKHPDRLEILTAWPLTAVGKVDKKKLAAALSTTPRADSKTVTTAEQPDRTSATSSTTHLCEGS